MDPEAITPRQSLSQIREAALARRNGEGTAALSGSR
jgi:hypothetical protein